MSALTYDLRPPRSGPLHGAPVLVLLHGVGGNERNLLPLAGQLDPRFAVVSVRAPLQISPDGFAFFNVRFTPEPVPDAAQAEASRAALTEFIPQLIQAHGFDPEQVFLLGFSQGAIIGASVTLSRPDLVAGLVMLSGRILPEAQPTFAPTEQVRGTNVFVAHGVHDAKLGIHHGRASHALLRDLGTQLTYREYDLGHEIAAPEVADVNAWLTPLLRP
ncbi:alpha/beta hydrolase [Deinococcus radiotolerans]|uniref:Phospholipase/carboxylesterase n=1 Tax=Deinococcus radiotolerans TaxID=1309407 RepID=A0ABQ2FMQ6_9DEIO|nr:alpha/beta fold hydrolase [Deinococcus radiotolerans]GGL08521.1 phospholipase/carboxylesterase [Deinococcus radiotolerans]